MPDVEIVLIARPLDRPWDFWIFCLRFLICENAIESGPG
jgi:hypothetical protein